MRVYDLVNDQTVKCFGGSGHKRAWFEGRPGVLLGVPANVALDRGAGVEPQRVLRWLAPVLSSARMVLSPAWTLFLGATSMPMAIAPRHRHDGLCFLRRCPPRLYPMTYGSRQICGRGEYDDEEEEDMWKHCGVIFVKDDVATIFARSPRGQKEFGEFKINQRAAVGLARYMQDPLLEFAGEMTI